MRKDLQQGEIAPTFILPSLNGDRGIFKLNRVVGRKSKPGSRKPVVLTFFMTTAIQSRLELAELQKLQTAFPEVAYCLVNMNESRRTLKRYFSTYNTSFEVLGDTRGELGKIYNVIDVNGVTHLPNTYFINESGLIYYHHRGFSKGDELIYAQKLSELTGTPIPISYFEQETEQPRKEDRESPIDSSDPINIAVMSLDAIGISTTEALALTNRLRIELFNTRRFVVLERGKMIEIMEEQGFQESGCTTNDCLVEVGELLNVQQMVAGSVSKVSNIFSIELRLVDIETGKIVAATVEDITGSLGDLLTQGVKNASRNLVE